MPAAEEPLLSPRLCSKEADAANGGSSSSSKYAKLAGALLLGAALLYVCLFHWRAVMAWVSIAWESLKSLGYAAWPIVALLCFLMTTLAGPVFVIEVSAGALFQQLFGMPVGALLGMTSCGFGVWLGCIMAFKLGQSFLKPKVKEIIESHEVLKTVNEIISDEGWKFAFLMRLNPLIPFELFNYAVAMTDISSCHNAVAALGTMPIVMFEVYSAASAAEIAQTMGGSDVGDDHASKIKDTLIKLAISGMLILVVCVYGKSKYDAKVAAREAQAESQSPVSRRSSINGVESHHLGSQIRAASLRSISFYDNTAEPDL